MCGIALIYQHQPLPDAARRIRQMTERIAHRGPDADDHFVDNRVALGHRRLSIIDLSDAAVQPMWDASGRYAIVFNGEIYNYRELKSQIADYPFQNQSDTEVILAGFACWGTAFFEKLNGIFAFGIYDRTTQELYLVRDRFGIKPLYYVEKDGYCAAASEQRSLLASKLADSTISSAALCDYLLNGAISGTQRICADIQELPAGYCLHLQPGQPSQHHVYHRFFEGITPQNDLTKPAAQKQLRHLLRQAVSRQLVSDVPLGAFLSGGIDSSAIVALMTEVSTEQPMTFSIGFVESRFDESQYAEMVAKKFNTHHTALRLGSDDFLHELSNALDALDTPSLDGANTYVVSKITRKAGVTVALSGLGGDELFAGYEPFKRYVAWKKHFFWSLPLSLRRALASPIQWSKTSKMRRLGELGQVPEFELEHVYPLFRSVLDRKTVAHLGQINTPFNPVSNFLHEHNKTIQALPLLSQYSVAEMSGYTSHMLLKDTDQMSMASGLEVRVPFFDNDLVAYVLSLPDAIKYPHSPKELLVQSLGDLLPPEIVHRPKMGFTLPWEQWLKGPLHDFCDAQIQSACDRQLLNPDKVQAMWQSFQKGQGDVLWSHVWMLVVLEYWMNKNLAA